MITAQISTAGNPNRIVDLEQGVHKFGSDFDCDVVLDDEAVQPMHFALDVTAQGVSIMASEGAEGRLAKWFRKTVHLVPGQWMPWRPRAKLRIGALVVRLRGDECRARPSFVGRAIRNIASQTGRIIKISAVVLTSVAIVSVTADLLMREITKVEDPMAAPSTSQISRSLSPSLPLSPSRKAAKAQSSAAEPTRTPVSAETVTAALTERGFPPAKVAARGDGWTAIFYLADENTRANLGQALSDVPFKIIPQIYLEPAMNEAIELVIGNAKVAGALVETLSDGELELTTTVRDADKRKVIHDILMSDVKGLRKISFVESSTSIRFASLQKEILAIWNGQRPYVALKDGREIKVGQSLTPGIDLIRVSSANRLLLRVEGKEEEFTLQ